MTDFSNRIRPSVVSELELAAQAERRDDVAGAFAHLENAHVLGQMSTREHIRVHAAMLAWGLRRRDLREVAGQVLRLIGAATKTALGFVPSGNTGGANISPFKSLPIRPDLQDILDRARPHN